MQITLAVLSLYFHVPTPGILPLPPSYAEMRYHTSKFVGFLSYSVSKITFVFELNVLHLSLVQIIESLGQHVKAAEFDFEIDLSVNPKFWPLDRYGLKFFAKCYMWMSFV